MLMENATHPSCYQCAMRADRIFCDLPADALQSFDAIKAIEKPNRGDVLFHEGRLPRGVFVVCEGRVKLSICSETGKRLMLRIAGPGEVLGLSASVAGKPYEVTAEVMDNSQVAFVKRKDLLKFLREHREACLQVVHLLSQDLHVAFDRVRTVGLTRSRRPRIPFGYAHRRN